MIRVIHNRNGKGKCLAHRGATLALCFMLAATLFPGTAFISHAAEEDVVTGGPEMVIPEDAGEGYIVKLKEDRSPSEEQEVQDTIQSQEGLTEVSYTDDVLVAENADQVQELDAAVVDYVEPNHPVVLSDAEQLHTDTQSRDPYYEEQYYLNRIGVPAVWGMSIEDQGFDTPGVSAPVIAVIDSGLYTAHEDIDASRVLPGKYFGVDGVTDDTSDNNGHGTQVTGIMMATRDNGLGIAGLSQQIQVMPLKVVNEDGSSTEKQVIEAIHYATSQRQLFDSDNTQGANIQVINLSLEVVLSENEEAPRALQEACEEAMDAGILLVCAGGNDGTGKATYPAQYTLGVGATGFTEEAGDIHLSDSRILSESNGEGYENKIWICAPGSDLRVPTAGDPGSYTMASGTSFAAPQVAVLAAMCKSIDADLDQQAFKALLKDNARYMEGGQGQIGGQDVENGYGLVDYQATLTALAAQQGIALSSGEADSTTDDYSGATEAAVSEEEPAEEAPGQDEIAEEVPEDPESPGAPDNDVAPAFTAPVSSEEYLDDPESPENKAATDQAKRAPAEESFFTEPASLVNLQAAPYYLGIDVSYWNGEIDWAKVKAAGVRFVIIRVAYAGWSSGSISTDYMFDDNIEGAYKAGLKVGVYIYSQATTTTEARNEANYVIDKIKPYKKYITLPVVMDMESPWTYKNASGKEVKTYWARANVSKAEVVANYKAFASAVSNAGYQPMFYTYTSWITEHIGADYLAKIKSTGYPLWIAEYPYTVGESPSLYTSRYGDIYKYEFWQYSKTGKVSGISGNVDMNRWYAVGWRKENGGARYYYGPESYYKSRFVTLGGKKYYFDADGYVKRWLFTIGGKTYYANGSGALSTNTFVTIHSNGDMYCFDADGAARTGVFTYGGKRYCGDNTGKIKKYLFMYGGNSYYAKGNGELVTNRMMTFSSKGKYYFGADGAALKGLFTYGGKRYCGDSTGKIRKYLFTYGGHTYYANGRGELTTSKMMTIKGNKYYFNRYGAASMGKFKGPDGKTYYAARNGVIHKYLFREGGKTYYANSSGALVMNKRIWFASLGKAYYFGADGAAR